VNGKTQSSEASGLWPHWPPAPVFTVLLLVEFPGPQTAAASPSSLHVPQAQVFLTWNILEVEGNGDLITRDGCLQAGEAPYLVPGSLLVGRDHRVRASSE
jgi:hypothetical protein